MRRRNLQRRGNRHSRRKRGRGGQKRDGDDNGRIRPLLEPCIEARRRHLFERRGSLHRLHGRIDRGHRLRWRNLLQLHGIPRRRSIQLRERDENRHERRRSLVQRKQVGSRRRENKRSGRLIYDVGRSDCEQHGEHRRHRLVRRRRNIRRRLLHGD